MASPSKPRARKRVVQAPAIVMHSAASPEWGTPMLLRRFAARVLAPAAVGHAIDLDYSSSAYWNQWWDEGDRPHAYLDGSAGRDVLVESDRRAAAPHRPGSGFLNPAGLGGGDMVQDCWGIFEQDHRKEQLGSGIWIGFSVEQLGSLQNIGERNPLTCDAFDLITTIVPSRRAHYVVHPEQFIAITRRKMKKRARGDKQRRKEQQLITRIKARTDDAPVDAGAPSHLSFLSILWHRERSIRRTQMEAARIFLKDQREHPKSLLHKFEVIGALELEGRA